MSMFDDVMGFGRTSVMESMMGGFEPEVEETTLESVAALDESVDPMDFILQVAYENEMNMKNLDMAIMAEEYMFLRESSQEMVYEETKMQSIIDKFKSGVKWLWENIQKFFKEVMRKFDEFLKLDQRFLDKYESKAAGNTALYKGWTEDMLDCDDLADEAEEYITNIANISDNVFDDLIKSDSNSKYADIKSLVGLVFNESPSAVDNNVDIPKEFMKGMLKGAKEGKAERSYKADKIIELFKKSKNARTRLKSCYNANKKAINAQIKTAKKMESNAKRAKIIPTETSKAIHGTIKTLNKLGSIMTLVNRTFVKLINTARSQQKAIIVAAAAKSVATAKKESASIIDAVEFGMTF